MPIARLDSRALISIKGEDAKPFLHNLLTQDVETLADGELRFGALLSPPGRLLFDLFILGRDDGVLLDVADDRREALLQRLTMYRLRAKVSGRRRRPPRLRRLAGCARGLHSRPAHAADGRPPLWRRRDRRRRSGRL